MDAQKNDWREEVDVRKKRCGFLLELFELGVKLPQDKIALLHRYRYLHKGVPYRKKGEREDNVKKIILDYTKKKILSEPILTEMWMPKPDEVGNYPADFVEWIDSINQSFRTKKGYRVLEQALTLDAFFFLLFPCPSRPRWGCYAR